MRTCRSLEFSIKALIGKNGLLMSENTMSPDGDGWFMIVRNTMVNFLSERLYSNAFGELESINKSPFGGDFIYCGIPTGFFDEGLLCLVDTLRRKGILYKTRQDKIFMSLAVYQKMLERDMAMASFHQHLNPTYVLSGEDFEAIDLHALAGRIRFLSLRYGEEILINNQRHLFPGAVVFGCHPGMAVIPTVRSRTTYTVLREGDDPWIWKHLVMRKAKAKNDIIFDADGQ